MKCDVLGLLAVSVVCFIPSTGLAQADTGSITGTVVDATGAALAGVTLTAVDEATTLSTSAVTNARGDYVLPALRIGRYTISAELAGFKKQVRSGIALQIQERLRIDFHLQVGGVAEVVQVSAAGGVFQLWFGDRPVTSAAGIRATDLAMSSAWHRLLLQAGVYKLAPKGYVGLAHDQGHVQELAAAAGWALGRLTR